MGSTSMRVLEMVLIFGKIVSIQLETKNEKEEKRGKEAGGGGVD